MISKGHTHSKYVAAALRDWEVNGTWVAPVARLKRTWELSYEAHGYPEPDYAINALGIGAMTNKMVFISEKPNPTKEELLFFGKAAMRLIRHWGLPDDKTNWLICDCSDGLHLNARLP